MSGWLSGTLEPVFPFWLKGPPYKSRCVELMLWELLAITWLWGSCVASWLTGGSSGAVRHHLWVAKLYHLLSSEMALSILPTATELAALTTLEQIRAWTQTPTETWRVASDALGTVPSIRVLALTPADIFRQMLRQVRIPVTGGAPRELGSVEAIQLALMWRVSRQAYQLEDLDILAPGALYGHAAPAAAVVPSPKAASSSGVKRLKVSNFVDQLDDTEVDMASKVEIDEAYRCFREATGADPQPEADPTPEQIAVMRAKVVVNGEAPYGDFSVLTPYGRRVQKIYEGKELVASSWWQLQGSRSTWSTYFWGLACMLACV